MIPPMLWPKHLACGFTLFLRRGIFLHEQCNKNQDKKKIKCIIDKKNFKEISQILKKVHQTNNFYKYLSHVISKFSQNTLTLLKTLNKIRL